MPRVTIKQLNEQLASALETIEHLKQECNALTLECDRLAKAQRNVRQPTPVARAAFNNYRAALAAARAEAIRTGRVVRVG